MARVLVVDDEPGIRSFVAEVLDGEGHAVTMAADGDEAMRVLDQRGFHLLITDLRMPRVDGMALVRKSRSESPEMEVIVLTGNATVATAVEAMKLGAFDYLVKPLSGPDELRIVVGRALERRRLREERQRHQPVLGHAEDFVAHDPLMLEVAATVDKVAATDASVLLLGESGTGKEVVARRIHKRSRRSEGPFVAVNCAALSDTLLESEIFGHERGAFTGASAMRRGRFELADGGTLFLDEIAELRPALQAKLLRVLQDHRFERVGGTKTIEADVRVIAATNRDPEEEQRSGALRADLYHRLAVFPIRLPPLRDRPGDVVPLAQHLLERIGQQLGRPGFAVDEGARSALLAYDWPGNVRELANILERAAILAEGPTLTASQLALPTARRPPSSPTSLDGTLEEMEREAIKRALAATDGHRRNAAARLGIGLRTLYEKLKAYGIE
jgi:two-component system, NtrC family, response regulator AtoC